MSSDRVPDSGYGGSVTSRRPSEDRRRPSESDIPGPRRSEDNYRPPGEQPPLPTGPRGMEDNFSSGPSSRRKPSQDTGRRSEDREREREEFTRRPSAAASVSNNSDSTATAAPPAQSTTAGSGMIIPNKSTIEEEYIEVPYGREQRESGATIDTPGVDGIRDALADDSASDYQGAMSPRSPPAGGLNGLSSRLREIQDDDDHDIGASGNKSGDDFYDKYGRSSVQSDRSMGQAAGRIASRVSSEEQEKIRREYEYKIATMQSQITTLQRDLADSNEAVAKWKDAEARAEQAEDELNAVRRVRSCSFVHHSTR